MTSCDCEQPSAPPDLLVLTLENQLMDQYGPLLGGGDLPKALGYPTMRAFQQAIVRGTIDVPIFAIEKRRGKFALVRDVATWLAKQRRNVAPADQQPRSSP
jgi:hypothetical protein